MQEGETKADPRTFKADLYLAAKENDTEKILGFLAIGVPPGHVDPNSGMTVACILFMKVALPVSLSRHCTGLQYMVTP